MPPQDRTSTRPTDLTIRGADSTSNDEGRILEACFQEHGVAGRLEYSHDRDAGTLLVRAVEVRRTWRRTRIATRLYDAMLARHPGARLLTGVLLSPEAEAFRAAFDRRHSTRIAPVGLSRP